MTSKSGKLSVPPTVSARPENESTSYYFLEVEKSRQGSYRDGKSGLLRKLERYAEYHGSDRCLKEWGWFDEFRVLIVVKNYRWRPFSKA